jgi:hypothetical protein
MRNLCNETSNPGGIWRRFSVFQSLYLLVGGCLAVCLFFGSLANSAYIVPDLHSFVGIWHGQFRGTTFVTLKLKEQDRKLVGTCLHTIRIERNSKGELIRVSETNTEDQVLATHIEEARLILLIADNGNEREPLKCAIRLTGKDAGELQVISSDGVAWKPWKVQRTSRASGIDAGVRTSH